MYIINIIHIGGLEMVNKSQVNQLTSEQISEQLMDIYTKQVEVDKSALVYRELLAQLGVQRNRDLKNIYDLRYSIESITSNRTKQLEIYTNLFSKSKDLAYNFLNAQNNYYFLRDNFFKKLIPVAFDTLKDEPDLLFKLIDYHNGGIHYNPFSDEQLKSLYKSYGKYYLDNMSTGTHELCKYCLVFHKYVSNKELNLLAQRLSRLRDQYILKQIMQNKDLKFTPEMLEKIESRLLCKELIKNR
jgi:hypothetical protein